MIAGVEREEEDNKRLASEAVVKGNQLWSSNGEFPDRDNWHSGEKPAPAGANDL